MSKIEQFNFMDGYTFDEGVAFLVLVKSPNGVINHIKATHNRNQLHSEIHRMLRLPVTKRLLKEKGYNQENKGNFPQTSPNFPTPIEPKSNEIEPKSDEIEPKSNEIEPKSDEIEPKSDKIEPKSDENETSDDTPEIPSPQSQVLSPDSSEIILTKLDVRTHENTRLEDMPNDLCRTLWLKRQEVYREMEQAHLKMRAVPEGEEHNEERAHWRAEVLRLDAENDKYWQQIDAEIERFNAEQERADKKANETPGFDISTYRAYISKALRKNQLTPAQLAELQHRVDAMIAANVELKTETLERLKAIGITI